MAGIEVDKLTTKIERAIERAQGDLFGIDPTQRLKLKQNLNRGSKFLRELRQNHRDTADELLTLNSIAARQCFERGDMEGLARHSALVLQYTLPRLNAVMLPGAGVGGQGGAMVVSWQPPAGDQLTANDATVIDQ